jgi:hypothetical protein
MSIKWNWGTGIIFVYSGFVVFMLGMVYLCTLQNVDLVTADYYEEELKFQQVIDGKNNEHLLDKATVVVMGETGVTVTLPMEQIDEGGTVMFYKPDNSKYDFTVALNGATEITVPKEKLMNGMYKVKATWRHEGKPYFNEQALYVQ